MDEAGGKPPVLVFCSRGRIGRQVNCGRAGVPYMEENRKQPVTFFYKPMGEPEGEGRTLAFPHHLSPNVDQRQPRRTLTGNTKAKDEINQHLLKSCCLVPVLSGRRSKIHQQDFAWDFPGGPGVKTLCFHCRGHRFNPWLGN